MEHLNVLVDDGHSIDDKEADQHILVQLKAASDMLSEEVKGRDGFKIKGGAEVNFDSGVRFVKAEYAAKVVEALGKLKPTQREKIHSHIKQSYENFQAIYRLVS